MTASVASAFNVAGTDTDARDYTTASWTPTSGKVYLVGLASFDGGGQGTKPTLSGNSITWTYVNGSTASGTFLRMDVWVGVADGSAAAGALTFSGVVASGQTADGAMWGIAEVSGADTISPIVQSGLGTNTDDNLTVTLSAFGASAHATAAWMVAFDNGSTTGPAITAGSGFAITSGLDAGQAMGTNGLRLAFEFRNDNDTSVDATAAAANDRWAMVAIEIRVPVAVSDADTGSGADGGEAIAGAVTDGDTGSGADAGESIAGAMSDGDTASGADAGESVAGTVTDGDTGSGADGGEAIAIRVDVTDGDTGSGVDAGETIAVTVSDGDTGSGADAGEAIAVTVSDGDTGSGVDAGSVYTPPVPPPPPGLRGLSSADLLDLRVSQRIESVVWVILNYDLTYAFTATSVDMDDPPTVHFDATAETNRTLSGLRFGVEDAARINPLAHLIQPRWVLDDGSTWPLGVFHFANTPLDVYSWGNEFTPDCYDRSVVLNQPRAGTFTVPVGMLLTQAIRIILDEVAMTSWAAIDGSGIAATVPMTFSAGTTRKRILAALCEALAFFPPYFDNDGFLRLRAVPNPISDAAPDVIYEADQWSRIVMDSVHASSNIADAPNVYRVVGSPAAGGEVVGEFRVPDSAPHSVARRGFEVVRQEQNQSVVDQQGANAAAQALYANDTSTHVTVDFETAPDPRADGNQIVRFLGTNYREMQWGLTCTPGGRMVHSAQEVWVP